MQVTSGGLELLWFGVIVSCCLLQRYELSMNCEYCLKILLLLPFFFLGSTV